MSGGKGRDDVETSGFLKWVNGRSALVNTVVRTVSPYFRGFNHADNRDFRYEATLSVWIRWFLLVGCLIETNYRIEYGALSHILNVMYIAPFMAVNGYVHYRLRSERRVSMGWLFVLSTMDVAMISFSVSLSGGFDSRYYVMYFPASAMFAWVFTSPYSGISWATMVAAIYLTLCLTCGGRPRFGGNMMTSSCSTGYWPCTGSLALSTSSRGSSELGRLEAAERELEMREERIEISQAIHDTVAQSVYLVGLGVETARDLAKETSK